MQRNFVNWPENVDGENQNKNLFEDDSPKGSHSFFHSVGFFILNRSSLVNRLLDDCHHFGINKQQEKTKQEWCLLLKTKSQPRVTSSALTQLTFAVLLDP